MTRFGEGNDEEECLCHKQDECESCRNSIYIEVNTPFLHSRWERPGSEVSADGRAYTEAYSEGNADMGKGLRSGSLGGNIREYGTDSRLSRSPGT